MRFQILHNTLHTTHLTLNQSIRGIISMIPMHDTQLTFVGSKWIKANTKEIETALSATSHSVLFWKYLNFELNQNYHCF